MSVFKVSNKILQLQNDGKITLLTIGKDEENMNMKISSTTVLLELNLITGIKRFKIVFILSSSNYTSEMLS